MKKGLEQEIIKHVTPEWRTFRDILWEFNGPRELTVMQSDVKAAMTLLLRRKVVERKSERRIGAGGFYAADNSAYRLRAQ